MKTTVITHQADLQLWASRVSDQKASGLLVNDRYTQNGVSRLSSIDDLLPWSAHVSKECPSKFKKT